MPGPGESLDALSGFYKIFQLQGGHRYSTDDLLVAWYGTTQAPAARRVLDLGSGIGSVGQVAAWRLPGASFVTIEAQDVSVALARRSVAYNGLGDRYEIRHGDFRAPENLAQDEKFDLILGSPPYFPEGTGIMAEDPQKAACRFELRGSIVDYAQVASQHLAPSGIFAAVFPEAQAQRLWDAIQQADLVTLKTRAVCLKEGEPPLLRLVSAMRRDHLPEEFVKDLAAPLFEEPPLVIRTRSGAIHPEYCTVKLAIGFRP